MPDRKTLKSTNIHEYCNTHFYFLILKYIDAFYFIINCKTLLIDLFKSKVQWLSKYCQITVKYLDFFYRSVPLYIILHPFILTDIKVAGNILTGRKSEDSEPIVASSFSSPTIPLHTVHPNGHRGCATGSFLSGSRS